MRHMTEVTESRKGEHGEQMESEDQPAQGFFLRADLGGRAHAWHYEGNSHAGSRLSSLKGSTEARVPGGGRAGKKANRGGSERSWEGLHRAFWLTYCE